MTPELQTLFDVSVRIREYEGAAHTLEGLARLCTDNQVRAAIRQVASEFNADATEWRRRQDADLIETIPSEIPKTIPVEAPAQSADVPLPPALTPIDGGAERVEAGESLYDVLLGGDR